MCGSYACIHIYLIVCPSLFVEELLFDDGEPVEHRLVPALVVVVEVVLQHFPVPENFNKYVIMNHTKCYQSFS